MCVGQRLDGFGDRLIGGDLGQRCLALGVSEPLLGVADLLRREPFRVLGVPDGLGPLDPGRVGPVRVGRSGDVPLLRLNEFLLRLLDSKVRLRTLQRRRGRVRVGLPRGKRRLVESQLCGFDADGGVLLLVVELLQLQRGLLTRQRQILLRTLLRDLRVLEGLLSVRDRLSRHDRLLRGLTARISDRLLSRLDRDRVLLLGQRQLRGGLPLLLRRLRRVSDRLFDAEERQAEHTKTCAEPGQSTTRTGDHTTAELDKARRKQMKVVAGTIRGSRIRGQLLLETRVVEADPGVRVFAAQLGEFGFRLVGFAVELGRVEIQFGFGAFDSRRPPGRVILRDFGPRRRDDGAFVFTRHPGRGFGGGSSVFLRACLSRRGGGSEPFRVSRRDVAALEFRARFLRRPLRVRGGRITRGLPRSGLCRPVLRCGSSRLGGGLLVGRFSDGQSSFLRGELGLFEVGGVDLEFRLGFDVLRGEVGFRFRLEPGQVRCDLYISFGNAKTVWHRVTPGLAALKFGDFEQRPVMATASELGVSPQRRCAAGHRRRHRRLRHETSRAVRPARSAVALLGYRTHTPLIGGQPPRQSEERWPIELQQVIDPVERGQVRGDVIQVIEHPHRLF